MRTIVVTREEWEKLRELDASCRHPSISPDGMENGFDRERWTCAVNALLGDRSPLRVGDSAIIRVEGGE